MKKFCSNKRQALSQILQQKEPNADMPQTVGLDDSFIATSKIQIDTLIMRLIKTLLIKILDHLKSAVDKFLKEI